MIPEFIGRTPVITETRALDEDDLVSILTQPKNAIVKQYRRMFQLENVELEFEDDALHEMRALRSLARPAHAVCAPSASSCFSRRCSICPPRRALSGSW